MTTQDTGPLYDLDRAARAAGFENDLDFGREVARRFRAVLTQHTPGALMLGEFIDAVIDMWEGNPTSDPLWLATVSNAYNALAKDYKAQVHEAKEARGDQ